MLGDRFGLLLHAQADGYQLVEAALVQSPILMETLGRLRARGAALLTEKNATAEDRALVMSMVDKANDRYDAIAGAIDKATAANPALKDKLAPALQAALAAGKQASELAQEQIVKADQLTFAGSDFFAKATEAISAQLKFYDAAVGELEKSLQERRSELNAAKYLLIGLVLLLLSIISIISYFVSRSVTTPISEAVDVARRVAAGDLTARIDVIHGGEAGELLQALKDMNDGLVNIVAEVRSGTETIATASEQIAAGNVDLSSRTEQQAGSLEETATSVREMAGSVSQNAENARQANQLAHAASDIAVRGGAMVSHVVQTMSTINDSSKRIFDIIGVIDSIAFQTNILALNAAVEAARAGEQGRGFAVVATEVRNLAQRSSAAAKEISQLINDSVEKVNAGTRQAGETGATMDEIVKGIKRVADIVAEIAAANGEQSAGIEQVNEAMQQMDQVTQQNAALVEEAAAAAESLQEQAHALAHVVSVFRLQDSQLAVMQSRRAALPQAGSDSTVPLLASGKAQAARLALPR
ncbi:HAMP domain-containing protein [Herbaspirillum sp. HC18]|nr:HAMP domain-containing protein [Herbaspirillum sp. HC18]